MITVSKFKTRFPEFCDKTEYPTERIEMFIEDTLLTIGNKELHWGTVANYEMAQSYLSAHLLTQGTKTEYGDIGVGGVVTSKSAGSVSVGKSTQSLDKMSFQDAQLMSTSYGQTYITIRNRTFVGVR